MKSHLEKIKVCNRCHSDNIVDPNCRCCLGKYKTIELEFDVCDCCGSISDQPADTEFNKIQKS